MKTLLFLLMIALFASCASIVRLPVEPKPDDKVLGTYHTWVTRTRMDGHLVKVKGERGWLLLPISYQRKDTINYTILVPAQ